MTNDLTDPKPLTISERIELIGAEFGIFREDGETDAIFAEMISANLDEMIGELFEFQAELRRLASLCT